MIDHLNCFGNMYFVFSSNKCLEIFATFYQANNYNLLCLRQHQKKNQQQNSQLLMTVDNIVNFASQIHSLTHPLNQSFIQSFWQISYPSRKQQNKQNQFSTLKTIVFDKFQIYNTWYTEDCQRIYTSNIIN